ncbi:ABC-2 type transport system permease protein [Streptomyces sp. CZ24]|jgi:ABC-2 type transport system permease protein|uniref:ABC transporter permease n=1 Tax=Streptomyces albidoflavus TaxID=1886 RepID=UPI00116443C6|nr:MULTISPECIES: ABC transporter permease [Streptomyces]MBL0777468.1 ABC transporter permease [Streptomyces albidoflavus]MCR0988477.1 ABC transporter permease [Streptomyces albidoflavus]MDH6189777.1 ABC-2 type transport system permease protein [Streptomyces sp. CZ24]QDD59454.1 ABC transporter permease [Streptomyces albidoflavus]
MSEALTLAGRCLRMNRRDPEALFMAILLPVALMLVFVYFFGGAIDTGSAYVTYVVPGLLVLCAGYGSAGTAMRVTEDMRTGVVDRFRSMGVTGTPMLAGHVAASVVRNILATAMVLSVALLIGFRPAADPLAWLAAAGMLLAYLVAVSWLAAGVGLLARTPEGASGFTFFLMFLPYPSSAFVQIETMPTWLHGFAEHQPVTPIIETLRALLLDEPVGSAPWAALAWCGGILLVAVAASNALFRFRTR